MKALTHFPPNRASAMERLTNFVPLAGRDYAARRNFDLGADQQTGVSRLSPYLRARLITEDTVLRAVLAKHSFSAAEKFVQEVYWRTYWKGWLEMRPGVWAAYQSEVCNQINALQTQSGLRTEWEAACKGDTGIACFDHWARELADTGYLHNHARMWFASIWIFTLRLPWELGADFFLRHLLDGDPASNTLGWRWVAGIQTQDKTYLARASNIDKFTNGRFDPTGQLAEQAVPLNAPAPPDPQPIPLSETMNTGLRTGFILHSDDLAMRVSGPTAPVATAVFRTEDLLSPLHCAPHISAFHEAAIADALTHLDLPLATCTANSADQIARWAKEQALEQIVTPYAPVGPNADLLSQIAQKTDIPLVRIRRDYDTLAWPHATHGFFRFKDKIPYFVAGLRQYSLAL